MSPQLLLRCPLLVHLDLTGLEELTDDAFRTLQGWTPIDCSCTSSRGRLVGQDLTHLLLKGISYVADETVIAMVSSHPKLTVVDYWGNELAGEKPAIAFSDDCPYRG